MRIGIVGAGSWGTTVAVLAADRADTRLWAREPEVVESVRRHGENRLFLDGFALPPALVVTNDLADALADIDIAVMAVPSQHVRAVITAARPHLSPRTLVVSLAKGIEATTGRRMSQVLADVLADHPTGSIGVLSGPNVAHEIMSGHPAATCVAFDTLDRAAEVQSLLTGERLRVYTSDDVIGCEIGGATKNVIAIAAGVADGLGHGANTKAALISRGLAETARLGVALGARPLTFLGLAGNGDLVATCTSPHSRNRRVGEALASDRPLAAVLDDGPAVAEGITTAPALLDLARGAGVELPICAAVAALLRGEVRPTDLVPLLMGRRVTAELEGLGG